MAFERLVTTAIERPPDGSGAALAVFADRRTGAALALDGRGVLSREIRRIPGLILYVDSGVPAKARGRTVVALGLQDTVRIRGARLIVVGCTYRAAVPAAAPFARGERIESENDHDEKKAELHGLPGIVARRPMDDNGPGPALARPYAALGRYGCA